MEKLEFQIVKKEEVKNKFFTVGVLFRWIFLDFERNVPKNVFK